MNKVAILVLADAETHGDLGRVVNAMMTAREFKEAGDEVEVIFDGAGTRCARAFEAEDAVQEAKVGLLEEYHDHPTSGGWSTPAIR